MVAKQLAIRGMLLDSWDTVYHMQGVQFYDARLRTHHHLEGWGELEPNMMHQGQKLRPRDSRVLSSGH